MDLMVETAMAEVATLPAKEDVITMGVLPQPKIGQFRYQETKGSKLNYSV